MPQLRGVSIHTATRIRMANYPAAGAEEEFHDDIIYPHTIPFVLVHLACLGAIWTGVTVEALVV